MTIVVPVLGTACGDVAGPTPEAPTRYDLLFDGEVGGKPRLFRATWADDTLVVGAPTASGRRPAPSPDGRRIAFQSLGTDQDPPTVMILEGAVAVPFGAPWGLAGEVGWSGDGRNIVFLSQSEDASGDIFVADARGPVMDRPHNLTPYDPGRAGPQPDRTPAWSPDGAWIAFSTYRTGGAAIWVMRPDGTDARPVTGSGAYGDFEPSRSPDSREIAFQRGDGATVRIGVVSVNGGEPRFLNWPSKAYNPAWSPDGEMIAFSSDVDGDMDIFVVSPDGGDVLRVRRPGTDRNAAWAGRH